MKKHIFKFTSFFFITLSLTAQNEKKDFFMTKGNGYEFHFLDDQYSLNFDFRGQFRAFYPYANFPVTPDDFDKESTSLAVSRARIKMGGHVFKKYYTFYLEQDIVGGNLLDARVMIEKYPYMKFKMGQWKVHYNRERTISSGSLMPIDRSIINSVFTVDRQIGASMYGDLDGGNAANFSYWASVFTGMGRGGSVNDDNNLMYMLRLQWNPNGEVLKFSGSDLEDHDKFVSSVAIAGLTNTSKYTSYSTKGGGQLYGFQNGENGQYKISQAMFETAFKYKGLSWEQELHYKKIDDRINNVSTPLYGYYVQAGYFFHHLIEGFPKPLEIYARQAFYDPDKEMDDNNNYEYTIGCNWFFKKHKNKLTLNYTHLKYDQFNPEYKTSNMVALQWDVSVF